jgi:hypothetical protein
MWHDYVADVMSELVELCRRITGSPPRCFASRSMARET